MIKCVRAENYKSVTIMLILYISVANLMNILLSKFNVLTMANTWMED